MTSIKSPFKRPPVRGFKLPTLKFSRVQGVPNMNHQASASSNERIRDNTPTLRSLYELLARPLP